MTKQFKLSKLQRLANFKKTMICLIALTILAGLWHVYGYDLKSKFTKAADLTSATVAPAVNNADNLAGNTDATWRFTIDNFTALSSSTNAVEITFPDMPDSSQWNLSGVVASSTTADATLAFATTSVAVVEQRKVIVMVSEDQTSADNDFILDIKGANNPMLELESFGSHSWSIRTCALQVAGDPSLGCLNDDIDSAATPSADITRRGGFINEWSFTPSSYATSTTGVEYTITFTASTTLNVGEKIHINFPNADFITNATTSDQIIVEGGTATVASTTIATSTNYGLSEVILTLGGGAIDPSATSTVTIVIGNITNPVKGSYRNLRVFTTTATNGLVDGVFYGMDTMNNFQPPPVESILIGGTNTVTGIVKVQTATTTRTVTPGEAAQIQIGMGCPDMMFFAGTKRVASDGSFTYGYLLDATYMMGAMPNNTSDESFFDNYLQPNMMQINVTGSETATVTPTFVVPNGVMQGSITGGPVDGSGVFIRAYTGDMESFTPIFTTADYTTEGLNNTGTGYFELNVKSGYTWNISIMSESALIGADETTQYWPPVVDPVYIESGTATTVLDSYAFVVADKTLNITLQGSNGGALSAQGPTPCLNIRRTGTTMMGPSTSEVCSTTVVDGADVYQMKVPTGAFVVEIMMPGAGFKEYPITVLAADTTLNKTIIIEQPTSYITGSVTDPDSFAMQGVAVMAQGLNGSFKQTLTNSSGEYTLYVAPDSYRVEAFAPGYGPLTVKTDVAVTDSVNAINQDFTITAGLFKKITGRIYTDIGTAGYDSGDTTYEGVHIHAFGSSGMNSAMSRSDGTYTLRVPAGSGYTVEAWSQNIGHINQLTGVAATSDIADQDFTVAAQGYLEITITAGNTYGLTDIFAWAYLELTGKGNGSDTWTATSSDADLYTKFSLPASSTAYRVDVGTPVFGSLTSLAANISASTTTITAGVTNSLTITLPAMVTVSGTTEPNATVWASRTDGPGKFNTTADSNGAYSMKLPKNYEYMIGASLPGYTNTPTTLTLSSNTTQNLTLTISAYSISGTVSSNGTALKEGFVWAVKAGNNGWTGADINADGSYTLAVDEGSWTVYAEAPCQSASNGVSQTGAGTVNISLTAIAECSVNVPDTQSFAPTTGGSISQSDVTINIPPNALGTGSTNVTLSVAKPSITPPATLNAAPIGSSTKRILVTNSSGNNVSSLNNSIEVTLDYSEADIPSGATEDDLQFAYWNTTTNTWDVVAATIDTTNNTITAKISHLTDFAPIIPTSANAPSAPTGLTATRNGDTGISLSWTAISGATSYLIYKDTSDSGNFPYLATTNSIAYSSTGLSGGQIYYHKVSASNANGESAASSAASATTCASVTNGTVSGSSCTLACNSGYSESSGTCVANSGGGGTITTTYCATVEYDEWQDACVSGWQYRNVLSRSPNSCTLTTAQESERKRACGATILPEIIEETKEKIAEAVNEVSATAQEFTQKIITIASEAAEIVKANINDLLGKLGFKRDLAKEQVSVKKYVKALIKDASGLPEQSQHALTNFIAYGTDTTQILGEGERAGVVNSYKSAFGSLPATEEDWNDVIKIANGRWPGKQNAKAEERATVNFKAVYLREPNRTNPHDDAAITVMAYGLRPSDRNLGSEKAAIRIFKNIYGYNPEKATAWDVVRAIAYSGATR